MFSIIFFKQVSYKPDIIHKFDTQVEVNILGWKTISLRMGGCVEYPSVDIDIVSYSHTRLTLILSSYEMNEICWF